MVVYASRSREGYSEGSSDRASSRASRAEPLLTGLPGSSYPEGLGAAARDQACVRARAGGRLDEAHDKGVRMSTTTQELDAKGWHEYFDSLTPNIEGMLV